MKYKVGDKVRIKSIDWYNKYKDKNGRVACGYHNFTEEMSKFCSQTMIICNRTNLGIMYMDSNSYYWTDAMIDYLVERNGKNIPYNIIIDKACEWLKSRISVDAPIETNENGEPLAGSWLDVQMERVKLTEEFIADFKQAMEGGAE